MGGNERIRVAIITSSLEWPGMIVSEIAKEEVDIVGVVLDLGRFGPTRKSVGLPVPKKLLYHFRLSLRFPRLYLEKVRAKVGKAFGTPVRSFYQSLNRKEEKLFRHISKRIGSGYAPVFEKNRQFLMLDQVCRLHDIPLREVDNANGQESLDFLNEMEPDLIIGLGTRILKPAVLAIPPMGILNGHSSILPDYRGGNTEFWQLVHGETETGVTIHFMSEKVDEGRLLVQGRWPVHPGADHYSLRLLSQFGRLSLWRKAVRSVCQGDEGTPQTEARTPTFRRPDFQRLYRWYVKGE